MNSKKINHRNAIALFLLYTLLSLSQFFGRIKKNIYKILSVSKVQMRDNERATRSLNNEFLGKRLDRLILFMSIRTR